MRAQALQQFTHVRVGGNAGCVEHLGRRTGPCAHAPATAVHWSMLVWHGCQWGLLKTRDRAAAVPEVLHCRVSQAEQNGRVQQQKQET